MNPTDPASPARFFCWVQDEVEGPYDLIELAGQLKTAGINGDTLIGRDGEETWTPFRDLPEFVAAQDMSVEIIARHLERKAQAVHARQSPRGAVSFPWPTVIIATVVLSAVGLTGLYVLLQSGGITAPASAIPVAVAAPHFAFPPQYRVEMILSTKSGLTTDSRIFVDNGRKRSEDSFGGTYMTVIIRPDLGTVYSVNSDTKLVSRRPYYPSLSEIGPTGTGAKFEPEGTEVMDRINCTKYRVTEGNKTWFLWVDIERQAPVRLTSESGVVTTVFRGYQVGPQDPALFEPPKGY